MRGAINYLVLTVAFSFCFASAAYADELSDLKEQIKITQKQMEEQQKQMKAIQVKLERLEAERAERIKAPEEMAERVVALEEKLKKPYDGGFLSRKGAKFELGGELEFEFVDTERDNATSEPDPHFQIDQLYLYPKVTFKDNLLLSADIAIKTGSISMEEVWAKFSGLPLNSWIEAGVNDMFIADIDRKTESEILIETAFYRDDDMGLKIGGEPLDWLYWRASITNGLKLDQKGPSEDNSYKIIHDTTNSSNASKRSMLGVGLGLKHSLGEFGKIDVLPFFYSGKLSSADVEFLKAIPGYGTATDDDKIRYGFNTRYDIGNFTFIGQLLKAEDGKLDRTGWFIQPSYKVKVSAWSMFNVYELVYRYNDLDVDLANTTANTLTWDRKQHVIGLITDIYKNVKLKTEYYINEEDTGGEDVNNNEFMTQLEIKF